jgi:hypothetical protein
MDGWANRSTFSLFLESKSYIFYWAIKHRAVVPEPCHGPGWRCLGPCHARAGPKCRATGCMANYGLQAGTRLLAWLLCRARPHGWSLWATSAVSLLWASDHAMFAFRFGSRQALWCRVLCDPRTVMSRVVWSKGLWTALLPELGT